MAAFKPTYSVEEFGKRVRFYFQDCEETRGVFPDESGMLNALDIEDTEYETLKKTEGYDKILRWAMRRRKSWLERKMVTDSRAANGCKAALMQMNNGGYSDKPAERPDRKLIVKLDMGGNK